MKNKDIVVTRLELVAAKAKQLAEDAKIGSLWDGDLQRGVGEMLGQLNTLMRETEPK